MIYNNFVRFRYDLAHCVFGYLMLFQAGSTADLEMKMMTKGILDPSRFVSRFNQSVSSSARLQIRRIRRKAQR